MNKKKELPCMGANIKKNYVEFKKGYFIYFTYFNTVDLGFPTADPGPTSAPLKSVNSPQFMLK